MLGLDLATFLEGRADHPPNPEDEDMGEHPGDSLGDDGTGTGNGQAQVGDDGAGSQWTQVEVRPPIRCEPEHLLVDKSIQQKPTTNTDNCSEQHHIVPLDDLSAPHTSSGQVQPGRRSPVLDDHPPDTREKLSRSELRKKRTKQYAKAKRKARRFDEQASSGLSVKSISIRRAEAAKNIAISYLSNAARHAPSGYVGYRDKKGLVFNNDAHVSPSPLASKSLEDLVKEGFTLINWDGKEGLCVLDQCDRIVLCGASPRDETWSDVTNGCAERIESARQECSFTQKQQNHCRGAFPALATGIAYGLGLKRPSNVFDRTSQNDIAMRKILDDHNIKRVAGFQSSLLDTYLPKVSLYYRQTLDGLEATQSELKRNFKNTPFGSITVNFVFYRKKLLGLAKDLPPPFYLVSFGSIANVYTEMDMHCIEEIVSKGGRVAKYPSYDGVISGYKEFCRLFHPDDAHTCLSSQYGVPLHRILHFFPEKDAADLDPLTMMFLPYVRPDAPDNDANEATDDSMEEATSDTEGSRTLAANSDDDNNEGTSDNDETANKLESTMDVDATNALTPPRSMQAIVDGIIADAPNLGGPIALPSFLEEWDSGLTHHSRCMLFLQRGVPQPYYMLRTNGGWSFVFACRKDSLALFIRFLERGLYGDFRQYTMSQLTNLRNDDRFGVEHYYGLHGYYRFGIFTDRDLALHFLQSEVEDWHSSSMIVTTDLFKARQWAYQDHPDLDETTHIRMEIGLYADDF
ncbi:hypothetical protein ONZ45_g16754 [Pleurotus djamor]|nr:hypothetical protein ONZ45_g16754 [Pleurotus djamor]